MTAFELFQTISLTTWKSIGLHYSKKIGLGEDSITSTNLINIAVNSPGNVYVEDTRPAETTKGCDFELWIGSDTLSWSRYAVQAKKIDVASSRYKSLSHMVGTTAQIDILDAYANANRAAALYCFYNYSDRPHGWNCNLAPETEQLGCSVTPSSVVRKALSKHGARNFTSIHNQPENLPWRCLVCCPHLTSKAALGHMGWPSLDTFRHQELPWQLRELRLEGISRAVMDLRNIVNPDSPLRPEWVAVVDIS